LQSIPPLMEGVTQPGTVLLGKYRVERVIGVGGMGAVVAARHLQLEERVAIKFLLPAMLEDPETVQRFLREARAAIKIRGEHCVRVLDVGTLHSGAPYMVMEYLDGQDLARVLEQIGQLPIVDAVDWILQAAEALAEAHAMGIVHRDLKPANLFLTRRADGTASVKVLDFGISKQTAADQEASVTRSQTALGLPRYMSPEQMRSTRDVDARADIWALGAVVHELIAGQPPFDAETMTALCAAILQDPPNSLRARRPDAPAQLEAAILGALEKDRVRRYPTVAAFASALAPFGTAQAGTSAARIGRILGVGSPTSSRISGSSEWESAFAPGTTGQPATAQSGGTTGGAVSDTRHRRSTSMVLAIVAAGGIVALAAAMGLATWRRHPAGHVDARQGPIAVPIASAPEASGPAPVALPSVAGAASVAPPPEPVRAAGAAGVAVSPLARPVRSPAPQPSARPLPGGARPPVAAPPGGAQPPTTPKPSPSVSDPFGDDRKG
jgi:eukaryotic-like serine/threonine-protein kinase